MKIIIKFFKKFNITFICKMPFGTKSYGLRGSYIKNNKIIMPPTLENKVAALSRKVGAVKPETKHFRFHSNITSVGTGNEKSTINVTNTFLTDPDFRDNVNGERFTNLALSLKFLKNPDCTNFRYIVYVSKKPGQVFNPSTGYEFIAHPDPNKFWVLADGYTNIPDLAGQSIQRMTKVVSLKKLRTVLSSSGTAIEKGEIRVFLCTNGATAATEQIKYSMQLTYHDN